MIAPQKKKITQQNISKMMFLNLYQNDKNLNQDLIQRLETKITISYNQFVSGIMHSMQILI